MKTKEFNDPITGELVEHQPPERLRIRNQFIDPLGREIPDPRPMAPPVGYQRQPSIFDLVRDQVARANLLHAQDREFETFEDNEDFDIPDDPTDPSSPWENDFDPPWSEVQAAIAADRAAKAPKPAPDDPARPPEPKPPSPQPLVPGVAKQDIP